jgi:heptosyltransferase-2
MRTLIIAPDTLSDAVMTQPLVALLRRFDPDGRIDVVAGPAVAAVFEAMGDVAEVFASRHAFGPIQPWGKFMLARRLDRHRHDRVFVLPTAKRAALVPWLAGIPIRIGLQPDTRWGLINQPHDSGLQNGADRTRQVVERFAHLAFDASHPLPGQVPNPTLLRDDRREAAARAHARLADDAPLLVLCVGSENAPSRRWPARHWAALIAQAAEEWPALQPVLVGDAADRGYATEIAALSGQAPRNLCGEQSLADTIALLAQAEAVVTHDIGLMHVAAAYARPMVAVFGPTDPRFSPPRSARAKVQWLHQECSPCNAPTCRFGHGQCMSGVRPDSVTASLRTAMRFATRDIR